MCSVTGVELAIYTVDDATLEPKDVWYTATIDLNINHTFSWSYNETAVLYFDVNSNQERVNLPMGKHYW